MAQTTGRKKWLRLFIPLTIVLIINIIARFPELVETYYTGFFYQYISAFLRLITGWLPLSLGDILYLFAFLWMVTRLFKTGKALVRKKVTRQSILNSLRRTIAILLWVFALFYGFWGLNYSRFGIDHQLKLEPGAYSTEDLRLLTSSLVTDINSSRIKLSDTVQYPSNSRLFTLACQAYKNAEDRFPFLDYHISSVKNSLWGWLGNYLGFLGYYNPFTGEAQVNTTVPRFVIPFTTCHEMAHQLGYATEDEANFAGFLAAVSSKDERFHYSAYFDLYNYANHELYKRDSLAAKANYAVLDTLVKKDIQEYRKFLLAHKNPVEPFIDALYGKYLQANNQPNGLDTYDEVVGWLIAYRKKYGDL